MTAVFMDEQTKAMIKDQFLAYALMRAEYFIPADFLNEFPDVKLADEQLTDLINEIIGYNREFFDVLNGNGLEIFMIIAKPKAEKFLAAGGFAENFEREENEWKLLFQTLFGRRTPSAGIPRSSDKHQEVYVKKDLTYFLLVMMALVGFLYAIYDLFFR